MSLTIQGLTKAADIGTIVLAGLSGLSVGFTVFYALWKRLTQRRRDRRFTGDYQPPAILLDVGSDTDRIFNLEKRAEATSLDEVRLIPLKIEKRKTSSTHAAQVEATHG